MVTTKKARTLPDEIRPLNEGLSHYLRMIIYGFPGVGKTPLAATAPNALIAEVDRGIESAVLAGSDASKWKITDYNDLLKMYEYLRNGGTKDFEFLVIDSGTMAQQRGMDHIMSDLVAAKPHRQEWLPDKGEYFQNQQRFGRFMRDFVDLDINLIVTAWADMIDREQPDGSSQTVMIPAFPGRKGDFSSKICGYMGLVAHLNTVPSKKSDGEYPVLSTRRRDGWYAKDRYGVVGRMPHPTIPKIMDAYEKKKQALTNGQGE